MSGASSMISVGMGRGCRGADSSSVFMLGPPMAAHRRGRSPRRWRERRLLDRDLRGDGAILLRQRELEHAVLIFRFRLARIDIRRQHEAAVLAAVVPLAADDLLA